MNARPHPSAAAPEPLELPRTAYDASLLFRHMALLEIDRDELAAEDPLLFRELQAFCTLCRRQRTCASDLATQGDDAGWAWCRYCPNAATLEALGAALNCSRAARFPRPRGRSTADRNVPQNC